MTKFNIPFHLVTPSPWPLLTSLSLMNSLLMMSSWFHKMSNFPLLSLMSLTICSILWWRDIIREATFQGSHTSFVYKGLRLGMLLFILSEVFFFLSFFWAYFHSALAPSMEIGQMWPPLGIIPFNPFDIPLLNTIILVSSGLTVTWSHHALINNNLKESSKSLLITILLGIYFTCIQLMEYKEAPFTITDSIFGSTFFMATGFHGIHVIVGSIFLLITYLRLLNNHLSKTHHFNFEAAAWYWHFVDVIWLFLYLSIYWWSY